MAAQTLAVSLGRWTGAENRKAEGLCEFPAEEKNFFSVNIMFFQQLALPSFSQAQTLGIVSGSFSLLRWSSEVGSVYSFQEVCGAVTLPEVVSVRPHTETGPKPLWAFLKNLFW